MDFPAEPPTPATLLHEIPGLKPTWTGKNRMDWFIEVETEAEVTTLNPDFDKIAELGMRGLIVTARSSGEFHFISRFFAPQAGVPEDSVTGSAHCCLGPYWGGRLGVSRLRAFQASARGGVVGIDLNSDRVDLIGEAVTVLEGVLKC